MHYTTYESGDCWHGTKDEQNGADYWIKYFSELPEYYITKEELVTLDWKWGKAPAKFAPGKMLMMWIYQNRNNICHILLVEYGMRQISTITAE